MNARSLSNMPPFYFLFPENVNMPQWNVTGVSDTFVSYTIISQ